MSVPLRVALAELPGAPEPPGPGALAARWARIDDALETARGADAGLVVFPECALTGYAPWGPDPCLDVRAARARLGERARATGLHVVLGWDAGDRCTLALATPDGAVHAYDKRHPTPTEARRWRAGRTPGIVPTVVGRVGMLVCADVLHARAWEGLCGQVDLVVVAAAWPDYVGRLARLPAPLRPLARPVTEGSGPWRDTLLARAAARLGVPVVVCDATGPLLPSRDAERFRTASAAWDGRGAPVPLAKPLRTENADPRVLLSDLAPGCVVAAPQPPALDTGWRLFAAAYDAASRLRAGPDARARR
jgi:predicted amidohydrolase